MTPICKLPHKNGRSSMYGQKYKWPKLEEAFSWVERNREAQFDNTFFQKDHFAHDALSDCRATAEIYKWLVRNRIIKFPAPLNLPSSLTPLSN